MGSDDSIGNNGCFMVMKSGAKLGVIASDQMGWEHVSVSLESRVPTWDELVWIKDMFWDDEDCVVQYIPPKSEYVNNCKYCLHLWRPTTLDIIRPPSILVGVS